MIIAFFLPVSSCSSQEGSAADGESEEVQYRYPYQELAVDNLSSVPILVAYLWPAIMLGIRSRWPAASRIKLTVMETLLCLFSYWGIWGQSFLYRLEYGGLLAYAAISLYLFATLADLPGAWKQRRIVVP